MKTKKKLYLVLGMHRSGTSMLTNILNSFGIYVGEENELFQGDNNNQKGYYEYIDIVNLHEKMLKELGMEWYRVKNIDVSTQRILFDKYKPDFKRILSNVFEKHDSFCVKDPRMCLFLPMWKEIIEEEGYNSQCIVIFRKPFDVAQSLKKRNMMDEMYAVLLWNYYNIKILSEAINDSYIYLDYDELVDSKEELQKLFYSLFHKKGDLDFNIIDNRLRHVNMLNEIESVVSHDSRIIFDTLNDIRNKQSINKEIIDIINKYTDVNFEIDIKIDENKLKKEYKLSEFKRLYILIFGAGNCGRKVSEYLRDSGINNFDFIDSDICKQGKLYCNKRILSYQELIDLDSINEEYIIIIAIEDKIEIESVLRILMWRKNCKITVYSDMSLDANITER